MINIHGDFKVVVARTLLFGFSHMINYLSKKKNARQSIIIQLLEREKETFVRVCHIESSY